jgi:hypothetical protein
MPPCVAVKGKVVKKNGQPCAGAFVVFHPGKGLDVEMGQRRPFAYAGDDGSFELTTFKEKDGAPAGEYGVTVVWEVKAKDAGPKIGEFNSAPSDALEGRYGNPRQPKLNATVVKAGENSFTFEVE